MRGGRPWNAVDLFAGWGGWSQGWRSVTGTDPMVAVNHCAHAIHLHKLNHPGSEHYEQDVFDVDPGGAIGGRTVDWLHLSPDCTHFSRAKGGKPVSSKVRGLATVAIPWAKVAKARILSLENVPEFEEWGPIDRTTRLPIKARKGEHFHAFVRKLRRMGYAVEWRVLCAADYGAPTIRRRLFVLARRDGLPIAWPIPTHGKGREHPWRTAAECIDWSVPTRSIWSHGKPYATTANGRRMAENTCRRIAHGIVRYVIDNPEPFLVQTGYGERPGQTPRTMSLRRPLNTVVAGGCKHALIVPWIVKHNGGVVGSDIEAPLSTITGRNQQGLVTATIGDRSDIVAAFLTTYYGQGGGQANSLQRPMPCVVTKARHGLVTVRIDGEERHLCDIGMRMLTPRELANAQGFDADTVLDGTQEQQIARIGNSMPPQWGAALCAANLPRSQRRAA